MPGASKWITPTRAERRAGARRQRGATMVEYALVLALFVMGGVASVKFLEQASTDEVDNQARCIATRPPPVDCQIPAVTTTVPPDPGTPPEPEPPPPPLQLTFVNSLGVADAASPAGWYAELVVEVSDTEGVIEGSSVRVRFQVTDPAGSPPFFANCITGADGRCSVRFDPSVTTAQTVSAEVYDIVGPGERVPETLPAPVSVNRP